MPGSQGMGIQRMGGILENQALLAARAALGGLARRHEAISSNIANIDTPGYQRREVSFEAALESHVRGGAAADLERTHPMHLGARAGPIAGAAGAPHAVQPRDVVASRNDRNDVSIDEEMTLLVDTQLRYQALTQSVGRRLSTLRTVIRGG
jgi:flagellar basal-body rod protein FlgB